MLPYTIKACATDFVMHAAERGRMPRRGCRIINDKEGESEAGSERGGECIAPSLLVICTLRHHARKGSSSSSSLSCSSGREGMHSSLVSREASRMRQLNIMK